MKRMQSYIDGATAALALLAVQVGRSRQEVEAIARRVRVLSAARDGLRSDASALRERSKRIERIPLVGGLLAGRRSAMAARAEGELVRAAEEISAMKSRGRLAREESARLERNSRELVDAIRVARILRSVPDELAKEAEAAGNRATFIRRRGSAKRTEILDVCTQILAIGRRLQKCLTNPPTVPSPSPPRAVPSPMAGDTRSRVYLPIPFSMGHAAKRAGALYDPDVRVGSRMYVTLGGDLSPFERMLPLSFRKKPPRLSFPPIRPGAAGQAIWGVFDSQTWDHVRSSAYERTGRRCMLCGKQSGVMKSRIFPEDRRVRTGPVECHEVWEWSVPHEGLGIGIQRLKALLVVCFECHAVFHESFMVESARKAGLGAQVESFIEARRLALTRMSAPDLADSLARAEAEYAGHAQVRDWIMDLTHLGAQDFMAFSTPVMAEANRAGLAPERVAGISFVTDAGREFPARTAEEILAGEAKARQHMTGGYGGARA